LGLNPVSGVFERGQEKKSATIVGKFGHNHRTPSYREYFFTATLVKLISFKLLNELRKEEEK
jgi:hypothetical protein